MCVKMKFQLLFPHFSSNITLYFNLFCCMRKPKGKIKNPGALQYLLNPEHK